MPVEVRFDDDQKPDEILARNCDIHLERLTGTSWCLIIETPNSRSQFSLATHKRRIELSVVEVNMQHVPTSENHG